MWPLIARDGQIMQYVVVTLLWNYLIGYSPGCVSDVGLRYFSYVSECLRPSVRPSGTGNETETDRCFLLFGSDWAPMIEG